MGVTGSWLSITLMASDTHACAHAHVRAGGHTCMHSYMHTHTHTHTHTHAYMHTRAHTHANITLTHEVFNDNIQNVYTICFHSHNSGFGENYNINYYFY